MPDDFIGPEEPFVPLPQLESFDYPESGGFFNSIGEFFEGLGNNVDDIFNSWNMDLEWRADSSGNKDLVSGNKNLSFLNKQNRDFLINLWREVDDRKSPFYHISTSIGNFFNGITNGIKGIGEPGILETAKIVAFIYALTYAYSNIKSPPKRTYNYRNYPVRFSKNQYGWSYGGGNNSNYNKRKK